MRWKTHVEGHNSHDDDDDDHDHDQDDDDGDDECDDGDSYNYFEDGICVMMITTFGDDDDDDKTSLKIKSGLARYPTKAHLSWSCLWEKPAAHPNLNLCVLHAIYHEHVLKYLKDHGT